METPQVAETVLGWIDITKIVLASGVVAAFIGWLKDGVFKALERRKTAKYSAIGVVAKLDLYVLQTRVNVRAYWDHVQQLDPHTDYMNWPSCPYPELNVSDIEIHSLDAEHASRLAWVATEKAFANQHLHEVDEQALAPFDVYNEEAEVIGYFGYEAYLLAQALRDTYSLPPLGSRWEADDRFEDLKQSWAHTRTERSKLRRNAPQ